MNAVVARRADEIRQVVCRVLEVDTGRVRETDHFVDDLEADSMKLIELLANLEIEFDVEIDEDALDRLVTLRGVYEVLTEALDR
ncbi:acyl carrier protein [Amycolatopsis arida]|uniref:Acyl carrier protein n=1 Tax=Amycolatopsis arida TaxID=587909 RepID=A0A1I5X1W8_9PSEU|nr:acyl carrier protein [Amycolatopsis arida]TDX92562.1 acyl carrier protein [Amycolatopsis arida]SFQ25914.1 acyl carrier protein [Amycolatopsis arida]